MAVEFTYDIGYMGVVKLASVSQATYDQSNASYKTDDLSHAVSILATSGNLTVQQSPMFSTGVWGAGWYVAADQVAYAPNYITTSGSIGFQLTIGKAFTKIQDFAFEKRNEGMILYILPNGIAGYYGKGWCQSCSFTASQDAIVTGDMGFKTGNVQNCIDTSVISSTDARAKSGTANLNNDFGTNYLNVFPFWASGVLLYRPQSSDETQSTRPDGNDPLATQYLRDDIIDWNASYSSQLVLVATCANYDDIANSKQAKYCALGTMNADGSFTIFRIAEDLDPDYIRMCRKCTIEMGPASQPEKKAKLCFGSIIFSNGSTDIQTGSSFIQSSFNFTALGNGKTPIMSLLGDDTWNENHPTPPPPPQG